MLDLKASFWLLFAGQLTSATGTASTAVALPLVVLLTTGDLVEAGLVAFVVSAAAIVGKVPGGVLADRLDRRLLMVSCDLVRLAGMTALAFAVSAEHAGLPLFVAVGVLEGLLGSVFGPAASGAVRQLVDEPSWPRALSLMQVVAAAAMVTGPVLGGALVLWDPAAPFGFDAITYLVSAVCLASIRRKIRVSGPAESLFRSAVTGLRFVARTPFLLYAAVNAAVLNMVFNGLVLVLVATSAEPGQDSVVTGVQVAALGAGMLLGSVGAPALARRLRPEYGIALSTAAIAPPLALFTLFPTGWPSLVLLAVTAATAPLVNVLVGTRQLHLTPDALQGRVHSAVTLLAMAAAPLGPILAGIAVQTVGIGHTVLVAAGVVVVLAAAGWWVVASQDLSGTNDETRRRSPVTGQPYWTRKPDYPTAAETGPAEQLLGRTVTDPYRWMEDERHPALSGWLTSQNELTDRLLSGRDRDRWRTLLDELTPDGQVLPSLRVGSRCYQLENLGGVHQVLTAAQRGRTSIVYDPNTGTGEPRKIARWHVDPRGRLIAVEVHEGGDENGAVTLVDAATGMTVSELRPAATYATVAWSADQICYVAGERGHHRLARRTVPDGTDTFLDVPVPAPTRLEVIASPEGRWLLLLTRATLGDAPTLWVAEWTAAEPSWRRVHLGPGRARAWTLGFDDDLYVADDGGLLRFDLAEPRLEARSIADGADGLLDGMRALRGGVLVGVRRVGFERLVQVIRPGQEPVTLVSWLGRLRLGQVSAPDGDSVQVNFEDPVHGFWRAWVTEHTDELTAPHRARLRLEMATSPDGEQVPVTICDPGTDPGGPLPTLLFVYGGFGLDAEPTYEPALAAWVRSGGRVGWIHARGGSELGHWWVEAGRGAGKVRTVEDVCAAAAHLVETGQTDASKVAIIGASNGGLVVAAAAARAPEQFAAAVCINPLTDMVRYTAAGLGELWLTEYGDPAEPGELDTLLSYSPYHQAAEERRYPAVLLAAGTNNSRVPAWHAWKLCALLQRNTSSTQPVLLDTDFSSGHNGRDRDKAARLAASTLTLLGRATGLAPGQ